MAINSIYKFELPKDWIISAIEHYYHVVSSKRVMQKDWKKSGVPFYRTRDIIEFHSTGRMTPSLFIANDLYKSLSNQYGVPRIGDLLVTGVGSVGVPFIIKNEQPFYYKDGNIICFQNKGKFCSEFLSHLFQSNFVREQIDSSSLGTTVNTYTIERAKKTALIVPPLKEQQAIAEALSDADALIASLQKLIVKKKCMLASVKQQLLKVSGNNSERVILGDIATFSKGRHLAKSQLSDSGKSPCVHYGELFTKYDSQISEVFSRTNLDQDIVLSKGGEVLMPTSDVTPSGLAKASYLTKPNVVIGGDILIIQPNAERLYGGFLSEVIRYLESQILSLVSGSTVYHIYAQDMAKFAFKLPNEVVEQKQIVEIISDFRNEIEALNEQLAKAKKVKAGMMQELLTGRTRLI